MFAAFACLLAAAGAQIGSQLFAGVVRQLWGAAAQEEWQQLQQACRCVARLSAERIDGSTH